MHWREIKTSFFEVNLLHKLKLSNKFLPENQKKIGKIGQNFFAQNRPKLFYYAKLVWGFNFIE